MKDGNDSPDEFNTQMAQINTDIKNSSDSLDSSSSDDFQDNSWRTNESAFLEAHLESFQGREQVKKENNTEIPILPKIDKLNKISNSKESKSKRKSDQEKNGIKAKKHKKNPNEPKEQEMHFYFTVKK